MANIVQQIYQGPITSDGEHLWYGLNWGVNYSGLANTVISGSRILGVPFHISDTWIRYFVLGDPEASAVNLTDAQYTQIFNESYERYDSLIGADNPDLSKFRSNGGKLLTWHGLADPLIFPNGTIDYLKHVESQMGGAESVKDFFRLFLAPGVGHCSGGTGPIPVDPLSSLVAWVEEGRAPDTVFAETVNADNQIISRNLCLYPLTSRYQGGDMNSANNYICE